MITKAIRVYILLDWPQSLMSFFCSKTDNLSKIAIYNFTWSSSWLGHQSPPPLWGKKQQKKNTHAFYQILLSGLLEQ